MGFAEFDGARLVDYGVKIIRRGQGIAITLRAVEEIAQKLIREKRPELVVIEKNNFSAIQQNAGLVMAIARMKAVAGHAGVTIKEIAASTARQVVCGNGHATKKDVAKVLTSKYPELSLYIDRFDRHRQQVFLNVTDAIACGLAYLQKGAPHGV